MIFKAKVILALSWQIRDSGKIFAALDGIFKNKLFSNYLKSIIFLKIRTALDFGINFA